MNLSILAPPNNQVTLVGAQQGSGANDFGVCSVDQIVSEVNVAKLGLVTNHFPVLFHLLSADASDVQDENRQVWNKNGDWNQFRDLIKISIYEVVSISLALFHFLQCFLC